MPPVPPQTIETYNVGIAWVIFVVFAIPFGVVVFDVRLELNRFPPIGHYVEDWSSRHTVLAAILLAAATALLGHFFLHPIAFG